MAGQTYYHHIWPWATLSEINGAINYDITMVRIFISLLAQQSESFYYSGMLFISCMHKYTQYVTEKHWN